MEYRIVKEVGTINAKRYLGKFSKSVPTEFIYTSVVIVEGYKLLWGYFKGEENDLILIESSTYLTTVRPKQNTDKLNSWISALEQRLADLNTTLDRTVKKTRAWAKPFEDKEETKQEITQEVEQVNLIELWVISSFI